MPLRSLGGERCLSLLVPVWHPTGSPPASSLELGAQSRWLRGLPRCSGRGGKGARGKDGAMTGKLGMGLWIAESQSTETGTLRDGLVQTTLQVQHHTWSSEGTRPGSAGL